MKTQQIQEANDLRQDILKGQIPTPVPGKPQRLIIALCLIIRSQNVTIQVLKRDVSPQVDKEKGKL